MPSNGSRRLGDFDFVAAPALTDEFIGRRPGAKGIRFTIESAISVIGDALAVSPVQSVFGQTGTVDRLYLVAPDGTRHEVVAVISPHTTPDGDPIYELGIDQANTPVP